MLFKNSCIWQYFAIYASDRDLTTCVRGQAEDLTTALRTVVSCVVCMNDDIFYNKSMDLRKKEVGKT